MVVSMPASASRRRASRRPVASTSSMAVRCGISDHDRAMASAVTRRIPRSGCRPGSIHPSPRSARSAAGVPNRRCRSSGRRWNARERRSAHAAVVTPAAAASTSAARMRPPGPVPVTVARSTPRSSASLRTAGAAFGRVPRAQRRRAGRAWRGPSRRRRRDRRGRRAAGTVARAPVPPPSSRTTSTWPTLTMSPGGEGQATRPGRRPGTAARPGPCRSGPRPGAGPGRRCRRAAPARRRSRPPPGPRRRRAGGTRPWPLGALAADPEGGGDHPGGVGDVVLLEHPHRVGHVVAARPGPPGASSE